MITNKDMVYNAETRRYKLTKDYVLNNVTNLQAQVYDEFDANESTLDERFIERTSNMLYEYLKLKSRDYIYALERIETDKEVNLAFRDALQYQLEDAIILGDRAFSKDQLRLIGERAYQVIYANGLLSKRRPPNFKLYGRFGNDRVISR